MHWKTKGRFAGAALLVGLFMAANTGITASSAAAHLPEPGTALSDTKDRAHRHLDRFLKHLERNAHLQNTASVKILHSEGTGHVWVNIERHSESLFIGRTTQRAIVFSKEQILDWSFVGVDNRLYGNFTARAAISQLDAAETVQVRALLSPSPAPTGW